ncbi:MAG: energy-coupling factor transporter transmembrane protein EcfT [Coriobacteriia bacterium]|nr:energy-coupling factor transporter transmembrane protein EcfT [Coriobacteriia bacterium]
MESAVIGKDFARSARHNAFATYHPAVIFCYFVVAIVFSMVTLHPIFTALSFLAASFYAIYLRGMRGYLGTLKICLFAFIIIAGANALFNTAGLTVLFHIGSRPITWEALAYGLCAGGMLASVILWFSCYQEVMTSDKFLYLFAKVLPTVSLVISMIFRFVPGLIERSRRITDSLNALYGKEKATVSQRRDKSILMASILMGWSMESSIETADSMRARGFGVTQRSAYKRNRFEIRDAVLTVVLVMLSVVCGLVLYVAAKQFMFYPTMPTLKIFWWGYGVYAFLLFFPFYLEGRETLLWKRFRS